MRADRLIALVLLLQVRGRLTAEDLAARLEVSVRTIYRDLDALSAAGVPVYATAGPGGGVALPDDYELNLSGLHRDEARALFLASLGQGPGALADLGVGALVEAALRKLSAALPAATRDAAERARQRLLVDTADWWQTAPSPPRWLAVVEDAVWRDRRLRLTYGSYGKEPREHEVDPYALVAKHGVWYLVAAPAASTEDQSPAPLVFRVSRIVDAAIVDVSSRRPERFDLATFWAEWCAAFLASRPSYWVTLRASAGAARRLSRNFHRRDPSETRAMLVQGATGATGAEDQLVVEMNLERPDIAMETVLGYGPDIEVLAPLDFRQEVAARIAETANHYSRSPGLA